jgi:adenosylcobinamide amidohydrolase
MSATAGLLARPLPAIALCDRMLVVSFGAPVRACSWAIVGGGFTHVCHVAWLEVRDDELRPPVDPRRLAGERLRAAGIDEAVALLTSRRVATFDEHAVEEHEVAVRAVATVGLGNALRAGDPGGVTGRVGTINLLVHVQRPLSDEAILEASAIATEAKAAAVLEAGIASRRTGRPATGTGTDCTVLTCETADRRRETYAGKHTRVGALVGAAALAVVSAGIRRWVGESTP